MQTWQVDLGETALDLELLDLRKAADQAVDSVRMRFPGHRFVIRSDGSVWVEGDMLRIHRILVNLVENAAVHGPSDGLVTIELEASVDGATIAVSDRGSGVPESERGRIFERFVRLDEARARDAGGSGLGLAIAAEIVEAHGGAVSLDSSELGGARFVVRLPRESARP